MQAPNTTLYPGSTNTTAVKQLQDYLVSQGLLTEAQKATGYGTYGPQTTAAVAALQKKLGVDTSGGGVGNFGPLTSTAVNKPAQNQYSGDNGLVLPASGTIPGLTPMGTVTPSSTSPVMNPNPFNPSNVNISSPSSKTSDSTNPYVSSSPTPTFAELMKTFNSSQTDPITNDTLKLDSGYNSNPNYLGIQLPAKPADYSATTQFPVRGNQNDPVQSDSVVTPSYGNSNIDPKIIADAHNTANGNPTNYANPTSRGVLSQMIADRAMNRGLYAVEPGVQYSPDQINARRNAADHFYANQINDMMQNETKSATGVDTSLTSGATKATPYIQALFANPDVSKSPSYVKQLSALLKSQTPDEQIETVKRVVMQTLPISQQNQFTANDTVNGQIGGALAYLPSDVSTNPYQYQTQRFVTYLGGTKDPKYNQFKAIVGNITAPYLNQLYGAVLSSGELQRANQFVPDFESDDTATVFQKLKLLQATTQFANEKLLARYTGAPAPQFDDVIKETLNPTSKNTTSNSSNSGSNSGVSPLWNSY